MKHIVILTGAGISAESGIQTFRDSDGLWEGHNVQDVASPEGFKRNPKMVLDFYNLRRHSALNAEPNAAHKIITSLQAYFKVTVITQNIDDLHERAGNTNVVHLHGEITKCRSTKNELKTYAYNKDLALGDVAPDGGQLRPFIVWFGEQVPMMETAARIATTADIFMVVGTSLQVYPAASLINFASARSSKFIVDKKIPKDDALKNFTVIEEPATTGMQKAKEIIMKKYIKP